MGRTLDKATLLERRFKRLKEEMRRKEIALAIFMKPENVFYYSGFNPILTHHKSFVVVPLEGEPTLLVHCIRGDHAKEEAWLRNIQYHGRWGDKTPLDPDPVKAIARLGEPVDLKNGALGLELGYLPYQWVERLRGAFHDPAVKDLSAYCEEALLVKDAHEIDMIRKASALADRAMEVMIDSLRGGATEAEASTAGQHAMRLLWQTAYPEYEISGFGGQEGGIIDGLNCWILTGERIAFGCDCPKARKPEPGELVLPMVWAVLGGYYAENERTVFAGSLDEFKMRAYNAMLRAREAAFRQIRPGVPFERLYYAAVAVYEEAGFGRLLPGRIGHGIGLHAHEFPSIKPGNTIPLEPGMVFTVEPGIMTAAWGGVRHSDTVLVTEDGYELLTRSDNGTISI